MKALIAYLEKLDKSRTRLRYAQKARENGWSHPVVLLQIERQFHIREVKAIANFSATLPPADLDLVAKVFKDPYLFDFLGRADLRRKQV